jgi:hypothetical protein
MVLYMASPTLVLCLKMLIRILLDLGYALFDILRYFAWHTEIWYVFKLLDKESAEYFPIYPLSPFKLIP